MILKLPCGGVNIYVDYEEERDGRRVEIAPQFRLSSVESNDQRGADILVVLGALNKYANIPVEGADWPGFNDNEIWQAALGKG